MSNGDENGTHVTRREHRADLNGLRWEMRAWMLGLVLMILWRINAPDMAQSALAFLVP